MTAEQAIAIRDAGIAAGLEGEDITLLSRLGSRGSMTIIPPSHPESVQHTQRKEPVVGTAIEMAARRVRAMTRAAA